MHIILKPEMRRFPDKLESFLAKYDLSPSSIHPIYNWNNLARKIYSPQISNSKLFAQEIEIYLWLTNQLFGNEGVLFNFKGLECSKKSLYDLNKLKEEFRYEIYKNTDKHFGIIVCTNQLISKKSVIGKAGFLTVNGSKFERMKGFGRWDNFYFKYIHTSDPNSKSYWHEKGVISEEKILEDKISIIEWDNMKSLKTFKRLGKNGQN